MDYTRKEISYVTRMDNTNDNARNEGRIIGQLVIEIEANKKIMDTHIYVDNKRFKIIIKMKPVK